MGVAYWKDVSSPTILSQKTGNATGSEQASEYTNDFVQDRKQIYEIDDANDPADRIPDHAKQTLEETTSHLKAYVAALSKVRL